MRRAGGIVRTVSCIGLLLVVGWIGLAGAQSQPLLVTGQALLGGAGDQRGTAVAVQDGFVYVAGAGPEGQTSADTTLLAKFSTASLLPSATLPPPPPTPVWQKSWSYGASFGLAATPAGLLGAGWSHPSAGITSDGVGGAEVKGLLSRFALDNSAGPAPGGAAAAWPQNYFVYRGVESIEKVTAAEIGGTTYYYTAGWGQPCSYAAYVIAKYDTAGTRLAAATDSSVGVSLGNCFVPTGGGGSNSMAVAALNESLFLVGTSSWAVEGEGTTGRPAIWKYDANLNLIKRTKVSTVSGAFRGGTTYQGAVYAVGYMFATPGVPSSQEFLISKFNESGDLVWSQSYGGDGVDVLHGVVGLKGRLFAVGSTLSVSGGAVGKEGIILEIDPATGALLNYTLWQPGPYDDGFTGVATDGEALYVVGESRSLASAAGNAVGQNEMVLLRYAVPETTLSFDAVDASAGNVNAADYLAAFGITVTTSPGTSLVIMDTAGGTAATPSSGPNLLTQVGSNDPVSYCLQFASPVEYVAFTRPALIAGPSGITHPEWSAQALSGTGSVIATVGESLIASFSNVPAQRFTLTGGQIAKVCIASNNMHFAAFSALLLDDFSFSPAARSLMGPQIWNAFVYLNASNGGPPQLTAWVEVELPGGRLPHDVATVTVQVPGESTPRLLSRNVADLYQDRVYTLNLTAAGAPATLGSYVFRVTDVVGNTVTMSDELSAYSPLSTPTITSHLDNQILATRTPTIAWTSIPGAAAYRVRVRQGFMDQDLFHQFTAGTSLAIPGGVLTPGRRYQIRVEAYDHANAFPAANFRSDHRIQVELQGPDIYAILRKNGTFIGPPASSFGAGDTLEVHARLVNTHGPVTADILGWIGVPGSPDPMVILNLRSFTMAESLMGDVYNGPLGFTYTFTGSEPSGAYVAGIRLIDPVTGETIAAHSRGFIKP